MSNIVPTAANTGTIGTNSLSFYISYFENSNINHAYIGFIDTLVYMQNGASFYGPLQVLNPVTGDAVFTLTVNNSNQLNFESIGQTSPLTIDAGSNTLNLPNDLIASGTVSCSTLTAQQVICSPAAQGAALHIYGDADYSAELAFMTGDTKLFEVGTTTTNVNTLTGNFFFIYNNQNATYSVQIITGTIQQIDLNGDVNVTNTLTANTINATGASISSTLTANAINATTINAATLIATTINPNNSVVTYSGSETGNIYVTEPFTRNGYKKVVVFAKDYTGSNTITYSTAFTTLAMITSNTYTYSSSSSAAVPTFLTTLTEISIAADDELSIMSVVIEGW